jgi:hypothetical protein
MSFVAYTSQLLLLGKCLKFYRKNAEIGKGTVAIGLKMKEMV